MKNLSNPFPVNQYQGSSPFCEREEETKKLISSLKNHTNTVLHAPRRYGKTGLIQARFCHDPTQKNTLCIFMDVFSANNLEDLNNLFFGSIYRKTRGAGLGIFE